MPDESPIVSVIIPTRNRPAELRRCVASVLAQSSAADLEVIVVDDGSDPPVDATFPRTTVIRQATHVHACRARNIAAGHARGRYLVCLDDDTELTDPAALATALRLAEAQPTVGIIGFCQTAPDGRPGLNPAPNDVTEPCLVGHFSGCGALLRRDVFDRVGGFAEVLEYYYEELEYAMRVFDAGSLVAYHPGVRVVHYHDSAGRNWRRLHRLIARNALLTIAMRFPIWAVLPAMAAQQLKYVRDQFRDGRRLFDPAGPLHVWAGVARRLPRAIAARRALRWASLMTYKQYQRNPTALPTAP